MKIQESWGLPGGPVVGNPPANTGDKNTSGLDDSMCRATKPRGYLQSPHSAAREAAQ